jgi:excisionase family DNA binding protein
VEDVALRLKVHVGTIQRYVREGTLAASKIGKRYWIPAAAIDELLQQNLRAPVPPPAKRAPVKASARKPAAKKTGAAKRKVPASAKKNR